MRIRTSGITWQEMDGELVILDLDRSVYLTTNKTGALLTKLLVEDRSTQDLIDALVAEYGITADVASRDVSLFTGILTEKGMLE